MAVPTAAEMVASLLAGHDAGHAPGAGGMKKHPVTSKQCCVDLEGHVTDIVVSTYTNCIFIVATQYKKMGTMLWVAQDEQGAQSALPTYTVKHLFGTKDDILLDVCGRQLIEIVAARTGGPPRPLLVSLALKSPSKQTVRGVVDAVSSLL
eukprot:m.125422 g.125422  ORF g.125422 m.125422 type:complete len:150 (-) comp11165_c0_seq3:2619-3068(-)